MEYLQSSIEWDCRVCTFSNKPQHLTCAICATIRPTTSTSKPISLRRELSNEGKSLFLASSPEIPSTIHLSVSNSPSKSISRSHSPSKFQPRIGDIVHALYWEDGKYYPAEIVKIDSHHYRVRFLEFNNFETVGLDEIGPNIGNELSENARQKEDEYHSTTVSTTTNDFKADNPKLARIGARSTGFSGGGGGGGSYNNNSTKTSNHRHISPNVNAHEKIAVLVITGKRSELFTINGRGSIQRLARISPTGGGAAPASSSRRGGQSALRFSRLADSRRAEWVKKVIEMMNHALVLNISETEAAAAFQLKQVLICGGGGLKILMKSDAIQKEIHYTLREKMVYVPSGIDPVEKQRGDKLRKTSGSEKKGTILLDHELKELVRVML